MSLSCHHVSVSRLALIWTQLALLIVIGSCLPLVVHGSQDASLSSSSLIRRPNNNKKSDTDIHVVKKKKQEDEAHTDMLLSGIDERSIVDGINQHHSDNSLAHDNDHNDQSKDDLFFFQKETETMARQLQGDFNGSSSEGLGMDMVPDADANITFNVGGIMIEQATAEALCPLEWTLTIICVASTCIDFMDTCPPSTISKQSMPGNSNSGLLCLRRVFNLLYACYTHLSHHYVFVFAVDIFFGQGRSQIVERIQAVSASPFLVKDVAWFIARKYLIL